jgi:RNA polymerase I-specific transcription initiation factor RRN7
MFSSASEGETDHDGEAPRLGRRGRKVNDTPKLIDTLALCYLGTLTLRLPITLGDLHDWVTEGDMVYIRAIKSIPVPMKERLPSAYHSSLDPNSTLKFEPLHTAVLDLVVSYQRDYGAEFPPLNHPLLLYRYMKRLALPLEVYPAVTKLARLLGYTFTYPLELTNKRAQITDIPEAQIVSLIIVSVKLFYPFDDVRRYPSTATEPAAAVIDWDAWKDATSKFRKTLEVPDKMKAEELMAVKEKDVFSMSGSQMDQYLDWYQRTWTDESVREQDKDSDFRTALFREFPVGPNDEQRSTSPAAINGKAIQEAETERLKAVQSKLKVRAVITEEEAQDQGDIKRPGSQYKYFRKESDLPDNAKMFYEEAAKISGFSMKMLVKAVFLTEMKIQQRGDRQRKEKRQKEEL